MTQHERALSGLLFDPRSPELITLKHKAHLACQQFNAMAEDDPKRYELFRSFIGSVGGSLYLQGPLQFNYGCNTHIGEDFYANYNLIVMDDGPVTIGDHVMLGPNVSLLAASHPLIPAEREALPYPDGHVSRSEYSSGITIGSHVWIACGVMVCDGVTIGDGAVVGAGSVVTHDVPAGWLACGNPCRPIRRITEADSKLRLLTEESL